ncbi:hypothetical protein, partial [Acidipropionibacterium jensenii]
MTSRILLAGDLTLPELTEEDHSAPEPGIRTVVWGCDLTGITNRRASRARLRQAGLDALNACRHTPGARHIVLVYSAEPNVRPSLHRVASAVATRLHTELERRTGRDLDAIAAHPNPGCSRGLNPPVSS